MNIVPLVHLPIVPRYASDGIHYVPVVYTATAPGFHPSTTPREMSILIPNEPFTFPQPIHHRDIPQTDAEAYMFDAASIHPSLASSFRTRPREATWSQRLCRAFGLPIGTVSTVDSQSVRDTLRTEGRDQPGPRRVQDRQTVQGDQERQATTSGSNDSAGYTALRSDIPEVHSPVSVAATVHSDDYDLISNSTTISPGN
ncbi:aminoadipate-semialdehyde dehydrogenase large subunit [Fusarium heterosporum]|uniref:Aminoadipate-semialdehyde dehydrogenase large subunit n=1 Tax=Fusarium heterosporum TaxID=42747 RepID=A0A8H5SSS2_FUSHE|nr:aminoadipate-semialdehyde dehydrogenase large subunit [Fusarium heterosporum]